MPARGMRKLIRRWRLRQQTNTKPTEAQEATLTPLERQYLHFCQGGIFSVEAQLEQLAAICHLPEVTHLAFRQNDQGFELILATEHVFLIDPETDCEHDIGEFIVIINRKSKLVKFENITNRIIQDIKGERSLTYHHPHINSEGMLCMSEGKTELQDALTEGDLLTTVRIIVKALWSLDVGQYGPARIEHWPLREENA